jgi:hypothetical protein
MRTERRNVSNAPVQSNCFIVTQDIIMVYTNITGRGHLLNFGNTVVYVCVCVYIYMLMYLCYVLVTRYSVIYSFVHRGMLLPMCLLKLQKLNILLQVLKLEFIKADFRSAVIT